MNWTEMLKKFSPEKIVVWMSHLDSIMRFVTFAFSSGKSTDPKEGVHEAHKQMADEAIDLATHQQLEAELARDGYAAEARERIFHDMGRFFHEHRWFVDAFRESMSVITDIPTRIANLKQFALADDEQRLFLCQQIDERAAWARLLMDRFVEAGRTWERVRRQMPMENARHLYEFMNQLSWLESRQFALSIGALKLESDRNACLNEVFAAYPDMCRMREIAIIRGLIKPSAIAKAVGEVFDLAKKLATPRPHTAEELARAQALLQSKRAAMRAAFARNPLFRIFNR